MSQKSAKLLHQFFQLNSVSKVEFAKLTGIGRTSLYKYLKGEPIHKNKARSIEKAVRKNYKFLIPYEDLIN